MNIHVKHQNLRWALGEKIVEQGYQPLVPLYAHDFKDPNRAGKAPCMKEWQKKTETTPEELKEWRDKNPKRNLGLVLGSPSGIVAIDVDGQGGFKILRELSGENLPPTVEYTTPGGGHRYIYRIPDCFKGKRFKKYSKTGDEPHTEVALLGDGQQTVLPYSRHPNGGYYEFVGGHSFDDMEIADAPDWMINLMSPEEIPEGMTSTHHLARSTSKQRDELHTLCSKCQKLHEFLQMQEREGLDEETWFRCCCLFSCIQRSDLAMTFSMLSKKHNARSKRRIEELATQEVRARIRCTSLGCPEADVTACFTKIRKNKAGEIINSPTSKLKYSAADKMQVGFTYDEEGNFKSVNCNIFVDTFLTHYDLRLQHGLNYYVYHQDNHWEMLSRHELGRLMRAFFDRYEPKQWHSRFEAEYLNVLRVKCPLAETLETSEGYICLENGLLDTEAFRLVPHTPGIFSTTKIPVHYNPDAQSPAFDRFLDSIFGGDPALIDLLGEVLGYCLIPSVKAEKAIMFLGSGANGKSLTLRILADLVGKRNVSTVSLGDLSRPFARVQLLNKLVNISTETEVRWLNTEVFKSVVSGDPIQFEQKGEPVFTERPFAKIVAAVNRLPRTRDTSDGFKRRLLILPFQYSFVDNPTRPHERRIDRDLYDKLCRELDGIFAFAVRGLKRLKENGYVFSTSRKADAIAREYVRSIDPYADFVQTVVSPKDVSTQNKVRCCDLKSAFEEFCLKRGWQSYASQPYNKTLAEIRHALEQQRVSFKPKKINGKRYVTGIALRTSADWEG
ncbi:phage/plasmid primase, P4 family [Synergistaceae bacterium OttesenSCG-928-I11]|nr:phage/plasmid primase, P4 family [Synergistaceae bacterium OttesenSCG-928-I11]